MKTIRKAAWSASLVACALAQPAAGQGTAAATPFVRVGEAAPFETDNRRKWGAPVIADLDGDGWDDIITTEHEQNVLVFWNNHGRFAPPLVVIGGDTHGLGVEDIDGDGRMDIVIARGGGDGDSPRKPAHYIVEKDRRIALAGYLENFEASRGRAIKFLDADRDGRPELFFTGFAPKKALEAGMTPNQLYLNKGGKLAFGAHLAATRDALGFRALATDFNGDGITDMILYGGRDAVALQGQADGGFAERTAQVLGPLAKTGMISGITPLDMDNDGDEDLFITRAGELFGAEQYYDPAARRFAFAEFRNDFLFQDFKVEGDLVLDNVQESYATFGIALGAQRTPVQTVRADRHMGGTLVVKPEQARGWPAGELKGLHIGYLGDGMWRMGGRVHSRLSAVAENVLTSPGSKPRAPLPAMLWENRGGAFADAGGAMGLALPELTTGAAAGDFDNDGFVDLAVTLYGDMVSPLRHLVLMNDGGKRFVRRADAGLHSDEVGAVGVGVAAIDYDRDGWLDLVYGNERGRWYLARNGFARQAKGRHLSVEVGPSPEAGAARSHARVELSACGKTWRRVAGAWGDGFSHMGAGRVHFGIGECARVDRVTVTWSNGEQVVLPGLAANGVVRAGR